MKSPQAFVTILDLLAHQARLWGTQPAFVAPDRPALSYHELLSEVHRTGQALAAMGIGRQARVALSLPGGPETAVASLSTMVWATCVPVNPALDRRACERMVRMLHVDAVIVAEGADNDIVKVAGEHAVRVVRLSPRRDAAAGVFELRSDGRASPVKRVEPASGDLALVLHTSGTTATARPVPLTHGNMVARARSQPVDSRDRCLSIAPLYTGSAFGHSLLAPLAGGASIGYACDTSPEAILEALHDLRVTYFSASPTVLSALLEAITKRRAEIPATLRFVRSSSNALSPQLQQRLESALRVPVIQGFGTTEAGTIAQNPLPPRIRKPGAVGLSVGPEIATLDQEGNRCASFETGAVVVRGPGVMSGYLDDADANRLAFQGDWFRTGDRGYLDDDGYLFLTGRIKELINRGGLKVAPVEVDEALMRHPDVREVATFAVPHPTLGEDVAAAVVFREDATLTADLLREFAFMHLAAYKVPSVLLAVNALARNALGKINRSVLARELDDVLRADYVPPQTAREEVIAAIFASTLRRERIGRTDNFFSLGGDSLSGMHVVAAVNSQLGLNLSPDSLFRWPTVARFAAETIRSAEAQSSPPPILPRRSPDAAAL
jgi:acyl-CoA synthetase (AMP-forming)/AMP-acid ligase II/acyl carrier protein